MKIEVHLLTHDDEQMLEWSLRHYLTFADRIIVHDGGPELRSSGVILQRYPEVAVVRWDTAGELNDDLAMRLKNECWRGTDADWVIVADMDELVWAKCGVRRRLAMAKANNAAVLRPNGFEMFADQWYEPGDHIGKQITELCPDGAPDDEWYAKPIVFSPQMVAESGFGIGAHESRPVLHNGRALVCDRKWPFCDGLCLLHYKSIFGGLERIAERYDATRRRLSLINVRRGWGNLAGGMEHAIDKRARLLAGVRRVVS